MKLNLGCGGSKLPGWINVDCESFENPDVIADLGAEQWPWPDNSADEAMCSHVLEHLPGDTFKFFLQQLYRVMKPGGIVRVALPWPTHDLFRNDPSHCRPVLPATLIMLSPRYIKTMREEKGVHLTDFGSRWGVNFELDSKIQYKFDPSIDTAMHTPEQLSVMASRMNNVLFEWAGTLRVVK